MQFTANHILVNLYKNNAYKQPISIIFLNINDLVSTWLERINVMFRSTLIGSIFGDNEHHSTCLECNCF